MNIIEDEVIGELRYLTVEFDQAELLAGHIGVISQGAVRRYFESKYPDLKVKKCGGLKLDSQRDIVTMRIGVVNRGNVITTVSDEVSKVKLLNPGYDEIQAKCVTFQREYDAIVVLYDKLETRYSKLIEKYDTLVTAGSVSESAPIAEEVSKADLEVFLNENPITGDVEDVEDLKMTGGDVEESDAE